MNSIPRSEHPIVLRTDFSNDAAWEDICTAIQAPREEDEEDVTANVEFVEEPEYEGVTKLKLLKLLANDYQHSFVIIADAKSFAKKDHPLLIVDLVEEPGREFRAVPSQIQGIENNLTLANMGFDEFVDAVGGDGVFRGFAES